jgi:hypothetical protein
LFMILAVAVLFQFFAVLVTTHNAASEGGRVAQVWRPSAGTSCAQEVLDAVQRTSPFFDTSRGDNVDAVLLTYCTFNSGDAISTGTLITVRVTVNWQPMFFATLFKGAWEPPSQIPLVAEVQVRHE